MNFEEINAEYYSIFRGQATSIPTFTGNGSREYKLAIQLANNAIKKWERTDGVLWRELIDTLQNQTTTVAPASSKVLISGTLTYTAPTNMRKPPAKVSFFDGNSQKFFNVIPPHELENHTELSNHVTFTGSANTGYKMLIGNTLSVSYAGFSIDYSYHKKATLFTTATDPAAEIPEISDPNFIIQEMVAARYANARNGFGYKVAKSDATTALRNMRIENNSGDYNTKTVLHNSSGWGRGNSNQDINL